MAVIGFIGLGHMGGPMAANLLKAGYALNTYDLSPAALIAAQQAGAQATDSVAATVKNADVVISMLPAGQHVRTVYLGDQGILAHAKAGALLIDCSTIDVDSARQVHTAAAQAGFEMLDAPVSGGTSGAEAGTLTFMTGGSELAFARAKPFLEKMGKNIFYAGAAGSGQAAKICNNMVLGITMIATCEAFKLAEKLQLAPQALFDIMAVSSGQTWSLTRYCPEPGLVETAPSNRDYQPGFTANMMLKDLRLSQQAAQAVGAAVPLGAEATSLYTLFSNAGHGDLDFSGIIKMLA